ncbi:MAG: PilZ domain-containing protein [Desulfuromonadales bacterium]|nr:PilZ domain-containing protein [Desulfuromonadales bacterium]NIR34228.1 PilZ domain-containing protein [Desulfuromonadales bacterium]NIS44179.1 PilZ domain-containing protein [Desulfuromonadales bacterium]
MNERKDERLDAINLLDYTVLDEKGYTINQAMGRTLNVSERGILLDTHIPFRVGQTLVLALELEEEIVELTGKVVHTEKNDQGRYSSGIEFENLSAEGQKTLHKYLEAFNSARTLQ